MVRAGRDLARLDSVLVRDRIDVVVLSGVRIRRVPGVGVEVRILDQVTAAVFQLRRRMVGAVRWRGVETRVDVRVRRVGPKVGGMGIQGRLDTCRAVHGILLDLGLLAPKVEVVAIPSSGNVARRGGRRGRCGLFTARVQARVQKRFSSHRFLDKGVERRVHGIACTDRQSRRQRSCRKGESDGD